MVRGRGRLCAPEGFFRLKMDGDDGASVLGHGQTAIDGGLPVAGEKQMGYPGTGSGRTERRSTRHGRPRSYRNARYARLQFWSVTRWLVCNASNPLENVFARPGVRQVRCGVRIGAGLSRPPAGLVAVDVNVPSRRGSPPPPLPNLRGPVALALREQIVPTQIPHDSLDRRPDIIITPDAVIDRRSLH
ncbi:MAG: hypothetical protein BJ554DRAFT_8372, partial [Olpidium bornovanus]